MRGEEGSDIRGLPKVAGKLKDDIKCEDIYWNRCVDAALQMSDSGKPWAIVFMVLDLNQRENRRLYLEKMIEIGAELTMDDMYDERQVKMLNQMIQEGRIMNAAGQVVGGTVAGNVLSDMVCGPATQGGGITFWCSWHT